MTYPKWATPERRARLEELSHLTCAKGEDDCPVMLRFAKALVERIGPPQGNKWAWLVRAAMATPKLFEQMGELDQYHFPPWVRQELITLWKAQDREKRARQQRLEQRRMHALPQIKKRGPFGTVDLEIYHAQRPLFEIVGIGLDAFTHRRVAQVSIPGLHRTIWVDLHGITGGKRRKTARFKRGMVPKSMLGHIEKRVRQQVDKVL